MELLHKFKKLKGDKATCIKKRGVCIFISIELKEEKGREKNE